MVITWIVSDMRKRCKHTPRVSGTSIFRPVSSFKFTFHSHQETYVYTLPRDFWSERGRRTKTFLWTTGSERKPCDARTGVDIVPADIARTIDISRNKETYCKSFCSLMTSISGLANYLAVQALR